jgi:AraC-like DNA-binding protein
MQRVSTRDVPQRERLAFVHDFVARNWAGMRFSPLDTQNVEIDIALFDLPDVRVARAHYPPMIGSRSRDLLSDGRDNYTLAIVSDDHDVSVAGTADFTVKAGDMILVNEATCFEVRQPRAMIVDVMSLGRRQIAERIPRIDFAPFYHIPRAAPGAVMFAGYADLLRQTPPAGEKARQIAAAHVHDLLAVALDGFVRGGTERDRSSVRAARFAVIKQAIRDRVSDPTLSIESIAKRQGVTPRYIQQLFAAEGVTFTEFVRARRLELAYSRLDAPGARPGIAEVAFACGFGDLSNFNRAFRQRYGMTPSDVRAAAMRRSSS